MPQSVSDFLFIEFAESFHVEVPFRPPLSPREISQTSRHQHQCRVTVREITHHSCTPSNFTITSFQRVICSDMPPVIGRKLIERKPLPRSVPGDTSGLFQTKRLEFGASLFRFLSGGLFILLCVDSLQHGGNRFGFTGGGDIQNIPEVYHATLPPTFREKIPYASSRPVLLSETISRTC